MTQDTKLILIGSLIGAIIIVGVVIYAVKNGGSSSGDLDAFASCIANTGTKFYGAFWCPHCQAQKALFGKSVDKLPYIECSTPDGSSQNATCNAKGIQGYPTWYFPNGTSHQGEMSLDELSAATGCPLPGATSTPTLASTTTSASSSSPAATVGVSVSASSTFSTVK